MNTYLAIITTVLVITQVIRVVQNTINLIHQNRKLEENFSWMKKNEVTEHDFNIQREVMLMLHAKLKGDADDSRKGDRSSGTRT